MHVLVGVCLVVLSIQGFVPKDFQSLSNYFRVCMPPSESVLIVLCCLCTLCTTTEHLMEAPAGIGNIDNLWYMTTSADVMSGDTIVLQAGVWYGCQWIPLYLQDKYLVIRGASPGSVVIDCENRGYFMEVKSGCAGGELLDLIIKNTQDHSMQIAGSCPVRLTNVEVSGSAGSGLYMAFDSLAGSILMRSCYFHNNAGHGVESASSEYVIEMVDCVISNNTYRGVSVNSLIARNSTFAANTGGGLYITNIGFFETSKSILENCTLSENTASIGGGAFISGLLNATNCVFEGNVAVYGGGLYVGDGAGVSLIDCVISGNAVTDVESSCGAGVCTSGQLSMTQCNVTRNIARHDGGGVCVGNAASVILESCTIEHNTADIGYAGGISTLSELSVCNSHVSFNVGHGITTDSTLTMPGTVIQRNSDWGVECSSSVPVSAALVCGNHNGQLSADCTCAVSRLTKCGTISSITVPGMIANTIYAGMDILVNGTDWTDGSGDALEVVILGTAASTLLTVIGGPPPVAVVLEATVRSEQQIGAIFTRSAAGVMTMSYDDFIFEAGSVSDCVVLSLGGPLPPATRLGEIGHVTFHLSSSCFTPMEFRLVIDGTPDDVSLDVSSTIFDLSFNIPDRNTANVVPCALYLLSPRSELLLNTMFEYYDDPKDLCIAPALVHSDVTTVRVCGTGIVAYNLSVPTCKFGSLEVPGVISDSCMSCLFSSSLECTDRPHVNVSIALYADQYVSAGSVELVCRPLSDHTVSPSSILLSVDMGGGSVAVAGEQFYPTDSLACKYSSELSGELDILTAGTYGSLGMLSCKIPTLITPCILQLSVSANGQDYVDVAPISFWSDGTDVWCPAGSDIQAQLCKPCALGRYKDTEGPQSCVPCGKHMTTEHLGSTSIYGCVCDQFATHMERLSDYSACTCKAGYNVASAGDCQLCTQGTYKNSTGYEACTPCGDTMTTGGNGNTNSSACICKDKHMRLLAGACECVPGYYYDNGCELCPIGSYKSDTRNGACNECAEHRTTADRGATSTSDCVCVNDYYEKDGECVPCASGATCQGGRPPISQDGYAADEGGVFVECLPASACEANNKCAPGYSGQRCSQCADGYYRFNLGCEKCSESGSWYEVTILVLVCLVVLAVIAYFLCKNLKPVTVSSGNFLSALAIAVSFLQVFGLIGGVSSVGEQIREPGSSLFTTLSSLNVNLQLLALECSNPDWTYFNLLYIKMAVVPLSQAVLWLFVCLTFIPTWRKLPLFKVAQGLEKREIAYGGVATMVYLLQLLYVPLTSIMLSYASCTKLENGPWVLDASPDIECFGSQHLQWLWLFVLGLVVYVLGVPLSLWYVVVHKRKALLDKTGSLPDAYQRCFGFFSLKYRDEVYWWELVVMGRKALLTASFALWSRSITIKIEVSILVLIVTLYTQVLYQPLRDIMLDRMERVTLLFNALGMTAALAVFVNDYTSVGLLFVQALFFAIVVCCVGVIGWIFYIAGQSKKQSAADVDEVGEMQEYEPSMCLSHEDGTLAEVAIGYDEKNMV